MKEKLIAFIKSTFSESDGTGSASRVLSGAVILSTISWITYLVLKNNALPDLSSASLFVGSGSSIYGMNKLSEALKKKKDEE